MIQKPQSLGLPNLHLTLTNINIRTMTQFVASPFCLLETKYLRHGPPLRVRE